MVELHEVVNFSNKQTKNPKMVGKWLSEFIITN